MRFVSETTANGVSERLFCLGDIPGVLWQSADATGARPLVLVGHGGGGGHKKAPMSWAHRLVACGFTVAAIDAPGCGDRLRGAADKMALADVRHRQAAGENVDPLIARLNAELARQAVTEWRAVLDELGELASGPSGYWGVSLGTTIGIPLVAAEPRISAAVLGFASGENLMEPAARITVPVEFLLQWDDDLVPRDAGLAVFDALASREKTLHVNPGQHADMPSFELDSAERFFTRHLATKHRPPSPLH